MTTIDLNSDVGESYGSWVMGDDAEMFGSVTSANLATGFHAGDASTIARTCRDAVGSGISIGAHVSYQDLAGFGRRFLDAAPNELADDIVYQLGALQALARREGAEIRYVKPHGALYNAIVNYEPHARAVVDAVRDFDDSLPLLGLPQALSARLAEKAGLRPVAEAFADRGYNPDGTLVSRREPNSVLTDAEEVTQRMVRLATEGVIEAIDGSEITLNAESICVHGDSPGAVAMAYAVRQGLDAAGVTVKAFA